MSSWMPAATARSTSRSVRIPASAWALHHEHRADVALAHALRDLAEAVLAGATVRRSRDM